jgi:DNA-binding transcriptional ArsR family regulator
MAVGLQLAPVLKALAEENRLAILLLLVERPRSVAELSAALCIGQTLTSHHLKALREVGLVTATAVGRSNRYAICCDAMAEPIRYLSRIAAASSSS